MNLRSITLFVALPLVIAVTAHTAWAADAKDRKNKVATALRITALKSGTVAPWPGALAMSADGRIAAHIRPNNDIVIWDPSHADPLSDPLEVIASEDKRPSAIALSPDGSTIAIGYIDSRLIVRSRQAQKPLREFFGHAGAISALTFSPDGQRLASAAQDATTQVWDIASGQRMHVLDSLVNDDGSHGSGIPVSIGFSGNGQALIVNEWYSRQYDVGRGTTLWDLRAGMEISTREVAPPNRDTTVRAGQALGAGGWLLAFTGDKGLMVERLDRCAPPRLLPFGGFADTVATDPLGRWVVATENNTLTFMAVDQEAGTQAQAEVLPAPVLALLPHPDGQSLFALVMADAPQIRGVGALAEGALYRIPVPGSLKRLTALNVSKDATPCAPTDEARRQQNYSVPAHTLELPLIAELVFTEGLTTDTINPPRDLFFAPDQSLYALYYAPSSDFNSGVVQWNLKTQRPLRTRFWPYVSNAPLRLQDGWAAPNHAQTFQHLLTGAPFFHDAEGNAHVVADPQTGEIFRVTPGHIERYASDGKRLEDVKTNAAALAITARNGRLAALYATGMVQVWPLTPRGATQTYKSSLMLDDSVENLALSADGRYLRIVFPHASGDGPDRHEVFRLDSGALVGDGRWLAPLPNRANRGVVADVRAHHLAVWDFDQAQIIARLPRQRSRDKSGATHPLQAVLSDDGQLLASASYDGLIRIWDIDAHRLIGQGRAGSEVTALVFDSSAQRLAAARKDGPIVVFQVPAN